MPSSFSWASKVRQQINREVALQRPLSKHDPTRPAETQLPQFPAFGENTLLFSAMAMLQVSSLTFFILPLAVIYSGEAKLRDLPIS